MSTPTINHTQTTDQSLIFHKKIQTLKDEHETATEDRKREIELHIAGSTTQLLGYLYETLGGLDVIDDILVKKDYASGRVHINRKHDPSTHKVFLASYPQWKNMYTKTTPEGE